MIEVDYYDLPNGGKPAEEFINQLELKMRVKIAGMIAVLKQKGHMMREPYSKNMGHGIFELRVKYAGDIARVFFFYTADKKAILTNGIIKKTEKTPPNALALARKYKAEYDRRVKNG